jgi:hypothetical protein
MPGAPRDGTVAAAPSGAPGVNVGAVSRLQAPMAATYTQFPPTSLPGATFYPVPMQPALPQARFRQPAPVQTLSPEQQADLAMRMALQMAGRAQGAAVAPHAAVAATPAVAGVAGATPTVTQPLWVTPPQ